jgi:hypothetical protein
MVTRNIQRIVALSFTRPSPPSPGAFLVDNSPLARRAANGCQAWADQRGESRGRLVVLVGRLRPLVGERAGMRTGSLALRHRRVRCALRMRPAMTPGYDPTPCRCEFRFSESEALGAMLFISNQRRKNR